MSESQIVRVFIFVVALLFVLISVWVMAPEDGRVPPLDPDLQADEDIQELTEEEK